MLSRLSVVLAGCSLLLAMPAEARFGKGGSSHGSSSSSSSHSHGSSQGGSGGAHYSGGGYNSSGGGYYNAGYYRPRWSLGYGFVPAYRYYGYAPVGYLAPGVIGSAAPVEEVQSNPIRFSAGVEAQGYVGGVTLGAAVSVEGDRWGFAATGQNIMIRKDDGSAGFDNIQTASAHLTYAFLTGQYGRLRVEGGADAAFAPNLITVGPTAGLSSVIWVGGPFAIESSLMVTPWPYTQVDGKLGAAIGVGPIGFRAGIRAQLLNDHGVVDRVTHQDIFFGPYVGVAFVL